MTNERKLRLATMVDRKAEAILEGTGQAAAIPLHMSLADEHFSEEDLNFIIDRACRLGRGDSVESFISPLKHHYPQSHRLPITAILR
jgi:hypothetical protein